MRMLHWCYGSDTHESALDGRMYSRRIDRYGQSKETADNIYDAVGEMGPDEGKLIVLSAVFTAVVP